MSTRFFTIESAELKVPEDYQGRFEAKTPTAAGSKAARQLFRFANGKKKAIRFVLRETTMGSAGKTYHYVGMRTKLETPRVIVRGGQQITIQYEYSVKACK